MRRTTRAAGGARTARTGRGWGCPARARRAAHPARLESGRGAQEEIYVTICHRFGWAARPSFPCGKPRLRSFSRSANVGDGLALIPHRRAVAAGVGGAFEAARREANADEPARARGDLDVMAAG